MARRETEDVLRKVQKVFDTAQHGLNDLTSDDPARRIPGFHNVIVFGRAVTFVLQNLRTIDAAAFDAWYLAYQEEMRTDPLLRYFHRLRTELEKEGGAETSISAHIGYLNTNDLAPLMANPPEGAVRFFVIDSAGGSGWEVLLPDGSTAKYYVQLPDSVRMRTWMTMPDAPTEHLGEPIKDQSVPGLARLYLAYMARLIAEARKRFG